MIQVMLWMHRRRSEGWLRLTLGILLCFHLSLWIFLEIVITSCLISFEFCRVGYKF